MISVRFKDTFRERVPEWISALALMFWGMIVLSEAPQLWDQQYFSVLANIATQKVWGYGAIVVGVARALALAVNGAWRPTAHIRAVCALASAMVWASIFISYLGIAWSPPSLAVKGALMIMDVTALWFAAGDAKLADIRANGGSKTFSSVQA